jgi:hypothetical protein
VQTSVVNASLTYRAQLDIRPWGGNSYLSRDYSRHKCSFHAASVTQKLLTWFDIASASSNSRWGIADLFLAYGEASSIKPLEVFSKFIVFVPRLYCGTLDICPTPKQSSRRRNYDDGQSNSSLYDFCSMFKLCLIWSERSTVYKLFGKQWEESRSGK